MKPLDVGVSPPASSRNCKHRQTVMHMSPSCISTGGLKNKNHAIMWGIYAFVCLSGISSVVFIGGPPVTGTPVGSRTAIGSELVLQILQVQSYETKWSNSPWSWQSLGLAMRPRPKYLSIKKLGNKKVGVLCTGLNIVFDFECCSFFMSTQMEVQ